MQQVAFKNKAKSKANHSHGQRVSIIQPKLMINSPGDGYEQEADAMADWVMRMAMRQNHFESVKGMPGSSVHRKSSDGEEEEKHNKNKMPLMRKSDGIGGFPASSGLVSKLGSSKGSGSPLLNETRNFMENAFSTDFSQVRIHADSNSDEMNREIQAKAFTHGDDIYFNKEYNPSTKSGQLLLAHELTHTIQQNKDLTSTSYTLPLIQRKTNIESTNSEELGSNNLREYIDITKISPQRIKKDVEEIKAILLEYFISNSDEEKILTKFAFWDNIDNLKNELLLKAIANNEIPEWPPSVSSTLFLDKLIDECRRVSFWKATATTAGVKQMTNIYDDLFRELEDANLDQYRSYLQKSRVGRQDALNQPTQFPNFWNDVALKTVVGLPGGITAGTGGLFKSLPFGIGDPLGNVLVNQSREYLKSVDYGSEKEIESTTENTELIGNLLGHGIQTVVGGQVIKAIAAGGKIAKGEKLVEAIYKGYKLYEKGAQAVEGVGLIRFAVPYIEKRKDLFKVIYKTINDIVVEFSTKHQTPNIENVVNIFLDRAIKEFLTEWGEEIGDSKETETERFKEFNKNIGEAETKEDEAQKNQRLAKKNKRKDKQVQRRKFEKRSKEASEEASELRSSAKQAFYSYLLRLIIRRLLINVIHEFIRFTRNNIAKQLTISKSINFEDYKKEALSKLPNSVKSIIASTAREVIIDVLKAKAKMKGDVPEQIADLLSKFIQKTWTETKLL